MQILKLTNWNEESQMAGCSFAHNRRFQDFLKLGIRPLSYRHWDGEQWRVHLSKLPLLVSYARRYFHHVDYSGLPEWVQMVIAKGTEGSKVTPSPSLRLSPYEVLHLLPSAPHEVVKAAYKALAFLHHPDRGGDPEVFKEIHNAFLELEEKIDSSSSNSSS
jgi:hypothetical protein